MTQTEYICVIDWPWTELHVFFLNFESDAEPKYSDITRSGPWLVFLCGCFAVTSC